MPISIFFANDFFFSREEECCHNVIPFRDSILGIGTRISMTVEKRPKQGSRTIALSALLGKPAEPPPPLREENERDKIFEKRQSRNPK